MIIYKPLLIFFWKRTGKKSSW